MKIKMTGAMKEKIYIGICISAFTLLFYFILTNFETVSSIWNRIITITLPFIIGFAIAFLLNPLLGIIENKLFSKWNCRTKAKRTLSLLLTFAIAILVLIFLFYLIIPSVIDSVSDLVRNSDHYIDGFSQFLTELFKENNLDISQVEKIVGTSDELLTTIADMFTKIFPEIVSTSYNILVHLFKILIGIVAGMYLLLDKERFINNVKKINFAILPKNTASYFHRLTNVGKNVFYNFIVGKAIDSLIIGIICYIGLSLFGIKYAPLLSVIVGITNMIPVFGPFIGAIPGMMILIIIEPIQCLYFTIFIFALQQFDGNILGPLILGDKLGIPSFWILFSVTVGGSLFGILGMFIGVPTFALIYFCVQEYVNMKLEKKAIDIDNP